MRRLKPKEEKTQCVRVTQLMQSRPVCSSRAFPDATSELQRLPPQFALTALEDISLGDREAILPDAGSACAVCHHDAENRKDALFHL